MSNNFFTKGDIGYAIDMSNQPRVFGGKQKESDRHSGMIEINKNAAKDKHDSAGSKTQKLAQSKQGINKKTKSDLIKSRPTHN